MSRAGPEATEAPSALAGRRVIELGDEKSAYCGKLFADMGADVIRIEPPGGDPIRLHPPFWGDVPDPDRGLLFLYTHAGKRSLQLDLDTPEGREAFEGLAVGADLLIETWQPGDLEARGLGHAALAERQPALVTTSITGFGQTGPWRRLASGDIVASALGGAMGVTGDAEDPPVLLAGSQALVAAGVCAAASSLIALHHAARSGRGQHVDVSLEEVVASVSHITGVGRWLEDGIIPRRVGTALSASCPSGAYRCKDGLVYLMVNRPLHWTALAQWIHEATGNQEVLAEMFEGPSSSRLPYRELIDLFISELTATLGVEEIVREGQRRHIAFSPVNDVAGVVADPQLAARSYFVEVDHAGRGVLLHPGAPYRHEATPWRIRRGAPRLGEHDEELLEEARRQRPARAPFARAPRDARPADDPTQALAGLRVVEFGAGLAGPWIGRFMAWCGAEVIKVESAGHPDVTRLYVPPRSPELGIQPRLSPWFTDWNAGKRFVSLDLRKPESIALCLRLVAVSDALVENYSAGVLEKLGLGVEELARVNPHLVHLCSTGYGSWGPHSRYVSWGSNIEAHAGLAGLSGFPHRECTLTQYAYPDALSALHGLFALLCGLEHRDRTGQGQRIDLSQLEVTVAAIGERVMEFLAGGRRPERLGNRSRDSAPQGCYRCAGEDRWVTLSVGDDRSFAGLCRLLGEPGWAGDPRFATREARRENATILDARIESWTAARSDYEAMAALQQAGVAAGVVQNTEDQLRRDPQLAARGFFEEIPHGVRGRVTANGIPLGLTGTPGRTREAGAARGQHNEAVFRGILGLSEGEYAELVELGAIETFDD